MHHWITVVRKNARDKLWGDHIYVKNA